MSSKEKIAAGAITLAAAFLILFKLGSLYLWSDEAHTALLARSVLAHGVPKGTDGMNSYSVDMSGSNRDMDEEGTWVLTPWLSYYLGAPFTALPAEGSEAWLRLPFALFGIMTVPLTFVLARRLFGPRTALLAAAVLVLYVPFLLYARQCRYYAPAMFFATWMILAFDRFLKKERHAWFGLLASQFFLFHTSVLVWAGMAAGLALFFLTCGADRKLWIRSAFLAGSAVLLNLPWYLAYGSKAEGAMALPGTHFEHLRNFLVGVNDYLIPSSLVLLFLVLGGCRRAKSSEPGKTFFGSFGAHRAWLLILLVGSNVGAGVLGPDYYFRYLVGVIPAAAILKAFMISEVIAWRPLLGWAAGALLVFTNVFSFPLARFLRSSTPDVVPRGLALASPPADYLYEITHEYKGPVKGIVDYLRAHARRGERVFISYGDLAIKYYLPWLRVLGGLTGEDLRGEKAEKAEWVIPRQYTFVNLESVNEYMKREVWPEEYEFVELDVPDLSDENIPEPEMHVYRAPADTPKVLILRRSSLRGVPPKQAGRRSNLSSEIASPATKALSGSQ